MIPVGLSFCLPSFFDPILYYLAKKPHLAVPGFVNFLCLITPLLLCKIQLPPPQKSPMRFGNL